MVVPQLYLVIVPSDRLGAEDAQVRPRDPRLVAVPICEERLSLLEGPAQCVPPFPKGRVSIYVALFDVHREHVEHRESSVDRLVRLTVGLERRPTQTAGALLVMNVLIEEPTPPLQVVVNQALMHLEEQISSILPPAVAQIYEVDGEGRDGDAQGDQSEGVPKCHARRLER